jgi:hypothetical protein
MITAFAKRNDISYVFTATLALTSNMDWTGASVRFLLRHQETKVGITGVGTVTGYGDGSESESKTATVSYTSAAGDLATAGEYDQEWEVTFDNGAVITFPTRSHNRLVVLEDLG